MKKNENRRAPRFNGKVPVVFKSGKGFTRNFSASGVYFETDCSFSNGQAIVFVLFLEHADPTGPLRMKCLGDVVRIDENGKKTGVAATINSYSLEMGEHEINDL